jgi:archaemetzincin
MKINLNRIMLMFIIIFIIGCNGNVEVKENTIKETTDFKLDVDTNGVSLKKLNNLFERKTLKPKDRSLVQYLQSNPNKPDTIRNVIYILPLGHMSSEIEEIIKQDTLYYQYFFQLKVKVLPRVSFDDIIKNKNIKTREINVNYDGKGKNEIENEIVEEQIDAKSLTDYYIIPNKPEDAVAILGITDHDIYSEKYNFLYGSSNIKKGAGVISTHRIKSFNEITRSNIRKVVSKQITNLFSIKNVKDYYCLLNFHNGMF